MKLTSLYRCDRTKIVKEYYDFSGIADYSAFRVMHGIIENTLSCLTGLNRHELDEKRCTDLKGLVEEVKAALDNNYDLETYVKDQGVQSDKLKQELAQHMQSVINVLKENKDYDLFIRLIRNWNQDKKLHLLMSSEGLEQVPKKLVDLLSNGNDAVVRDYLEYHGVEESKIDDLCGMGKKVADERTEFMNFVREYSDKEQDKFAGSTSLGKNEKKLLEKLGGALGMTLESRDELHYMVTKGIPVFALYTIFSNAKYKCNKEKYPLEELRDFCDKNKYKVKLVMLDSSANLSTEDLKSKLSDYISGQALDKLNHLIDQLNVKLHDNQGMYENLMKLDTYLVKELKKAIIQKDDYSIRYYKKRILQNLNQEQLAKLVIDNFSGFCRIYRAKSVSFVGK